MHVTIVGIRFRVHSEVANLPVPLGAAVTVPEFTNVTFDVEENSNYLEEITTSSDMDMVYPIGRCDNSETKKVWASFSLNVNPIHDLYCMAKVMQYVNIHVVAHFCCWTNRCNIIIPFCFVLLWVLTNAKPTSCVIHMEATHSYEEHGWATLSKKCCGTDVYKESSIEEFICCIGRRRHEGAVALLKRHNTG